MFYAFRCRWILGVERAFIPAPESRRFDPLVLSGSKAGVGTKSHEAVGTRSQMNSATLHLVHDGRKHFADPGEMGLSNTFEALPALRCRLRKNSSPEC
jgi:hypothetical protein